MSSGNGTKFDLKLSLSPPRPNIRVDSPPGSKTMSPRSCVSSEEYCKSPKATSMVLVGCPQCLMYIMLSEEDPRCPKCKTTVLLHVIHEQNTATKNTSYSSKSSLEFPK
ncbi:uncharacterized protein LOC111375645 [Olea europaea var. sylvestris]|uniref:uncharacterized protein LOC111375645 n=1 Tax=Olea europaea var. sylvestris TaxID=158386 RepID=UPI000C1CE8E4|nr:uncharacterized protein LOC111375645 [Olea europaea var. sylvestris]